MTVYHRNTNTKFILLWSITVLLVLASIYFIYNESYRTAVFMLGLTIIAAAVRIHALRIAADEVTIRRYSVFGFRSRTFHIPKQNFSKLDFWEHGSLDHAGSTGTWLDVFFIPALFVSGRRGIVFKGQVPVQDNRLQGIYISDEEYRLLKDFCALAG